MNAKTALVLASCLLAACTPTVPEAPKLSAPPAWTTPVQTPVWPGTEWWRGFSSTELDGLIAAARDGNQDMAAAAARMRQAAALARVAGAPLLPSLDAAGDVTREGASRGKGTNTATGTLSAAYEIDFWGKNRAGLNAAEYALAASRFDRSVVALTVTAGTAESYFLILSLRDRQSLAKANLDIARRILALTEAQVRAGTALEHELAQQRAQVAAQEAALPELEQKETEARAALALLLGRAPQDLAVAAPGLAAITIPAVAPGLPSDLLSRRPDLARAEADLAAAGADVVIASAARLPSFQLTGSAGRATTFLSTAATGGAGWVYALAAGVTQPLFDGGRLAGQEDYASARHDEAIAAYHLTAVTALGEVDTALAAIGRLDSQAASRQAAVAQSRRALALAESRYRAGAEDLLTVLDIQRTLFDAEDTLSRVRLSRLQAQVALFRVLGGGWENVAP